MRDANAEPFLTLMDGAGLLVRKDIDNDLTHCCEITGRAEITPQLTGMGEGVDLHLHILDETQDAGISIEMEPDEAREIAYKLLSKADDADDIIGRVDNYTYE